MPNTTTLPGKDYELLDSGEGDKLERFGQVMVSRPDPQALWPKKLSPSEWKKADAYFNRSADDAAWQSRRQIPERWTIDFGGLRFWIKLSAFKHTGIFPENQPNWDWMREKISKVDRPVNVLNLFGYTGGATLACAQAGASVCHVDGSKTAVTWARENAELSKLDEKPIRWIVDDARVFVQREIKRGRKYEAIILDPPAFGHGPKKELWKIESDLLKLLEDCRNILSYHPLFFLINGYASGYSAIAYANNLTHLFGKKGELETGELTIAHSKDDRLLPCGIFARWSVS
ncbi:MAG: SAM-dependent methyltransferase [Omnitrophica WOR_2 bacterium GWA2_47_8]|nr:MAG: SAM-dependent methyltransferase [Omnitrophica WOR_2 bacterium GWA2_47_8]